MLTPGLTGKKKTSISNASVLIVDDNDDHWLIIQQTLKDCLPQVRAVRTASTLETLNLLETCRHQEWDIPQLILLDLYLPSREQGWQLLRQIKSMGTAFQRIPIVMLSASAANDDIKEAYQLGVASYLVKPIDVQQWIAYFRELRTYWWETASLPPIRYQ
jgi:CheY-like chemotaxis protein